MHECYKSARLLARMAIESAKQEFYSRLTLRLCDPELITKEYFKITKRLYQGKSSTCIPPIIENGICYADATAKADIFNEYFASISSLPQLEMGFALPPLYYRTAARLSIVDLSDIKVYKVLKSLNVSKANGPDCISNRMLKETAEVICKPLSKLFIKSMITGTFPDAWKQANISPVFKKNNRQIKENYRPISLLSCVGKVMERIVFNELYDYCSDNDLLT